MPRARKTRIARRGPIGLSNEERIALLDERVRAETREFASLLRSRTDFEAVLVRGSRVDRRAHSIGLVLATVLAILVGSVFADGGPLALAGALALPIGYGLLWFFLAVTGGEQLERLAIDEQGLISSSRAGRDPGRRADVLKVGVPVVVIGVAGWITLGLIHDIVFPPQPTCMFAVSADNEFCRYIPGMGHGTGLTVGQAKVLERGIRTLQLLYSGGFLLGAAWFLRRMLTGRWVADVRPVRGRGTAE
jgi:hypothetical protein